MSGRVALLTVVAALAIVLALVFSFLCSVAEAVVLSVSPSFVADLKQADNSPCVVHMKHVAR